MIFFCIISLGLVDNNQAEAALKLFQQMNITPNEHIYGTLFKICANIADQRSLQFGTMMFNAMPKQFHDNTIVLTSALQMFIKCDDISKAEQIFMKVKKTNLFSFSIMMTGNENRIHVNCISLFFI